MGLGGELICKVLQIALSGDFRYAALKSQPQRRCARAQYCEVMAPRNYSARRSNTQVGNAERLDEDMTIKRRHHGGGAAL
jgi:putative transposase